MDDVTAGSPDERVARLLRRLPPAPEAWTQAAIALPLARHALDEIETRILSGAEQRAAVTADLEAALARAGFEPRPELVHAVRGLLGAA